MPGLAFDALDRHVIAGLGEELAWVEEGRVASYAQLLERTAALAGGLRSLGLQAATAVQLTLPRSLARIEMILAVARAELVIRADAGPTIDEVALHWADESVALTQLVALGRVDPARAPRQDHADFSSGLKEFDRKDLETLLVGGTVRIS